MNVDVSGVVEFSVWETDYSMAEDKSGFFFSKPISVQKYWYNVGIVFGYSLWVQQRAYVGTHSSHQKNFSYAICNKDEGLKICLGEPQQNENNGDNSPRQVLWNFDFIFRNSCHHKHENT